jgi:hypothetical protein
MKKRLFGTPQLIYVLVMIVIVVPYLVPLPLPVPISERTREVYKYIEEVPPGGVVMMVFDLRAGLLGELWDGAVALARHVWSRPVKIVAICSDPNGPIYYEQIVEQTIDKQEKKYGEDYVMLGYLVASLPAYAGLSKSMRSIFTKDYYGNNLDSLKMMKTIDSYKDVNLIVAIDWGSSWIVLVQTWAGPYGTPYVGCWTGVTVAQIIAYYPHIVRGIIAGARGAAEYEALVGKPGGGLTNASVLSTTHVLILAVIAIGNIQYFYGKLKRKRSV